MPGLHIVGAQRAAAGGGETDVAMTFAADDILQRRNSNLILSERCQCIGAFGLGATLSRLRFANQSLNVFGRSHVWPIEVSATIPELPSIADYRRFPLDLPLNEEITLNVTTTGAGVSDAVLFLAFPGWNRTIPRTGPRFITRATVVIVAGAAGAWTALAQPTFEADLVGGAYALLGAWMVAANAIAFRIFFPRAPLTNGRQLRPGGLVQNTAAVSPSPWNGDENGVWGSFHTFEPPSFQVYDDAAGGTYELRLDLMYLGPSIEAINRGF